LESATTDEEAKGEDGSEDEGNELEPPIDLL